MIQQLSNRFHRVVASLFLAIFYSSFVFGTAYGNVRLSDNHSFQNNYFNASYPLQKAFQNSPDIESKIQVASSKIAVDQSAPLIGGPSQPEMSSFKSVGTDNMVNLFTGDFSYNIPLMDVGGYPVNIFYDGGIGMEQEASWVGLGWNINPGNVSRNMRGIPDDFDGSEQLKQTQSMKKNKTFGITLGGDLELVGADNTIFSNFSGSAGLSTGISFNNYVGPALEFGLKGNTGLSVSNKTKADKSATGLTVGGSLGITASSRSGVTFSPSVSLSAYSTKTNQTSSLGLGFSAATSYNSRSGIKALQLSEQMSFSDKQMESYVKKDGTTGEQAKYSTSIGLNLASTSISFAKPSYIPSVKLPITNSAFAGRFEYGSGIFGVKGSAEVEVYKQVSEVAENDQVQFKPLVGFIYLEKAASNSNAVLDFTRLNDNEVAQTTPVISAPQYTYDVFSIQGEGTGGCIRAYRNDNGYVRDNYTTSRDKSISLGADVAPPAHYGGSFSSVKTPTTVGEWNVGNRLRTAIGFKPASKGWENVYFRNPGENSVLNDFQYDNLGGLDLVRFKLGGNNVNPTIEPILERFSKDGSALSNVSHVSLIKDRKKRTQVTNFLNAGDAALIGLDKTIKSYHSENFLSADTLVYDNINRYDETDAGNYRKKNHISQINVTEANGQRYIYGIPVYNIRQKDFTFTVGNEVLPNPVPEIVNDIVSFDADDPYLTSPHLQDNAFKDGFVQITETPAYAHSFLLSGLLSDDYVDVNGDGITEDDLGSAVKFNYTLIKIPGNNIAKSKWRTPLTNGMNANFNAGRRTDTRDDKGIISYGERESWYLHSLESKSMIAIFTIGNRQDAKGAGGNSNSELDELTGINTNDNSSKRLNKIDLYNKADLKKNGLAGARPVKTVHFEYSYRLCGNYPANSHSDEHYGNGPDVNSKHGKLTLERIYFTYNGVEKAGKSQYVFDYGAQNLADNPDYSFNATDRWGSYKPVGNVAPLFGQVLRNADFPYTYQSGVSPQFESPAAMEVIKKEAIDKYASAWLLKKILLPSGGQIEVNYESDTYAYIQDKKAAVMMEVVGFGASNVYAQHSNHLYDYDAHGNPVENLYAFIKVPVDCANKAEAKALYLDSIKQLSFKLSVQMPKGNEYFNSYANININNPDNYDVVPGEKVIWVKMEMSDGKSPLSLSAVEFLREQLPGQAIDHSDVSGETGLVQSIDLLIGMLASIAGAFDNPVNTIRDDGKAQLVNLSKCFVRLNDPDGCKYGGGYRVKSVKLRDNWNAMTDPLHPQYTSEYGQEYTYETTETTNGEVKKISSGVASYEPSFGGDENPFQQMLQVENTVPLGPTSYGSIELPLLDAFFPSPLVGYSKVTVRSLRKGTSTQKSKSGIGKQVTEYYTAKDYPVFTSYTNLDPTADKQSNSSSFGSFFWKYSFDSRALSQGFLVATNDMHGKMKSQTSYSENDDRTPVSFTQNFYKNTGEKGWDQEFDFVYAQDGGRVKSGRMGIDVELMTDTREYSVQSSTAEVQGQMDGFPVFGLGPWFPFIWPVFGASENTYRAVTTTKVISYHSILDRVVVIDKGSQVSTENILFDSETGEVVVNKTNNHFKQPVYSTSYPAQWAHSGMGLAYKNIDGIYEDVNFSNGKIVPGTSGYMSVAQQSEIFESGDELYVIDEGIPTNDCLNDFIYLGPSNGHLLWAIDKNKTTAVTDLNPAFVFITRDGKLYSRQHVRIRIIRSGKRNLLDAKVSAITSLSSPIVYEPTGSAATQVKKLSVKQATNVINASAIEYKEKWQVDYDAIKRLAVVFPSEGPNLFTNGNFSAGNVGFSTEYSYNPASGTTNSSYTVAVNPHSWNSNLIACGDHTSGSGNMLMINSATQSKKIWSQTVVVEPNTSYIVRAWITPAYSYNGNSAQIKLKINNESLVSSNDLSTYSCEWRQFFYVWNSGYNNSAAFAFQNDNLSGTNNLLFDDISLTKNVCGSEGVEALSCGGYIEKEINPYVKGLVGKYRTYQSKVFYDQRAETDPAAGTNISKNGILANFTPYWNFNKLVNASSAGEQLIIVNPAPGPTYNWVEQSEITKINSKGLELETRNAMGIYTAAQYGYNKTMPVALTNNSKVNEMFFEGFEDNNYDEALSPFQAVCGKKQSLLSEMYGSLIVNASDFGLTAHSGKRMLQISSGSASVPYSVKTQDDNTIALNFPSVTKQNLNNPGVNLFVETEANGTFIKAIDNNPVIPATFYTALEVTYKSASINPSNYQYYTTQYFEITDAGYYTLDKHWWQTANNYTVQSNITIIISSVLTNEVVNEQVLFYNPAESFSHGRTRYCMKKGLYKMKITYTGAWVSFNSTIQPAWVFDQFEIIFNKQGYQSLSSQPGCSYINPIVGTETMLNPVFSVIPYNAAKPTANKMLLSAWVKKDCSGCDATITVSAGNAPVIMYPSGPVIEGWQKIEGEFSAAANITTATVSFNKVGNYPVYFDDVRIHPYNANMKSYVYDPVNLRLTAELDENNYAKFYEYDEEGTLVRTKAETKEGIKTITETRTATQKKITTIQ